MILKFFSFLPPSCLDSCSYLFFKLWSQSLTILIPQKYFRSLLHPNFVTCKYIWNLLQGTFAFSLHFFLKIVKFKFCFFSYIQYCNILTGPIFPIYLSSNLSPDITFHINTAGPKDFARSTQTYLHSRASGFQTRSLGNSGVTAHILVIIQCQ